MNAKPKLAILPIAKRNQYQGEIESFLKLYRERLTGEKAIEALVENEVLFSEQQILLKVKEYEQKEVDLIMFVVGTWVFSSLVVTAANDTNVPFIVYGVSDRIANGNIGAAIQIKYVLEEMKKRFLFLSGKIDDEDNYRKIIAYSRAAWVKRILRNKKIATIGGKCMMMYQTQVNEFSWKSTFGVDFPQYDAVQIFKEMEGIDEVEAEKIAGNFTSKIDKIHWDLNPEEQIAKEAVKSQAKMYLAFKRMKELYGIDIFANKCMPEMTHERYGYGYSCCLATSMLNDDGIITACEADVPAALSMYILSLLSGRPAFFADIARLNKEKRKITFYNCGSAPLSLADRKKGISLWPIPKNISDEAVPDEYFIGSMKGACIHFDLEHAVDVTILRIGGNDETLRFHAARAKTASREVERDEIQGTRWPGFGLEFKEDIDRFVANTTGHHYSLAIGEHIPELRYLTQMLNIQFLYNE